MIGLWIDGLTDEERDRIVVGQLWDRGGASEDKPDAPMCVMQHAYGHEAYWEAYWDEGDEESGTELHVAYRFDDLVRRFGIDRVVRAIKKRAGASIPEQQKARASAGAE